MLVCTYCDKECKNQNSFKNHVRTCPSNPNRIYRNGMTGKKGRNGWMKAKEEGYEYIISEESHRKRSIANSRKHSAETKQKISEIRKRFLEANPDKVPYVINHSSKVSYPEQYFLNCFSQFTRCAFQFHIYRYHVDFANPDEKLYLEIDGNQHYLDKRIIEHDKKRTAKLTELGWTGFRIRWSDFQKLSDTERIEQIKNIGSMMKWLS